jgi:hypothetical protein
LVKSVLALLTGAVGEDGASVSAKAGAANVTAAIKRKTLIGTSWRIIPRDQSSLGPVRPIINPGFPSNRNSA